MKAGSLNSKLDSPLPSDAPTNRSFILHPSSFILAFVLIAATILAYQPAWHAGFIWDDDAYVTRNSLLVAPDGLWRIWFSLDSPSQYFPLTYTVFRLERALWGLSPAGYHWVNILLHAANALLVWRLLSRLKVPGAWLAAAIFALHPVNVESVAWVTELKNILSLFFSLLTLLAWVAFVEKSTVPSPQSSGCGARTTASYLLATIYFALALSAKTTACTLPAAMLLVLWLKHLPITWRRVAQVIPFVAMGMAMGLVAVWWERHQQGTESRDFGLGPLDRILIASRAIWFYAGKLLWPAHLCFSYPRWSIDASAPLAYFWFAASAATAAAIWYCRRFLGRSLEVAAAFYAATLSPLLGLIMLYTFHYSFVADHYQYMAMIGPAALMAAGLSKLLLKFETRTSGFGVRIFAVLCTTLLLTLATLTWRQCQMYRDAETLWHTTLVRNPQSFMAWNNLGELLLQQGRVEEAMMHFEETLKLKPDSAKAHLNLGAALVQSGKPDEAIGRFQEALKLQPNLAEAHKNLSDVFLQTGRLEDALDHSRKAVEIRSAYPEAQNNLGNALLQLGRAAEAVPPLRKAVELQPDFPQALNNLGVALIQTGQPAEAQLMFRKAADLQPEFAEAQNNLGRLLLQQGKVREAMDRYEAALKLQPNDPDTLCNLAWVLATWPQPSERNGARAVELAQRANDRTRGQSPTVLGTLAAALAERGQFADAVATAKRGLQLAEAQSDAMLADMLRSQIQLHEAGKPLREGPVLGGRDAKPE